MAGSDRTNQRSGLWWGTVEGAGLTELVAAAAASGFTDVSVTPAMYIEAKSLGASDNQLRSLLERHGVSVAVIDPLMRALPGARSPKSVGPRFRSTFEHGEQVCIAAAEALGAKAINVAHFLGDPTPVAALADAIAAVARRCGRRGIDVLVEFMPEGAIGDLATAAEIVSLVDRPNCTLTFDTWHHWRCGGVADDLKTLRPGSLGVIQLSDALDDVRGTGTEPPTSDRLLPGRGTMALADILTVAVENSPDVLVGVEVFNQDLAALSPTQRAHLAKVALDSI